MFTINMDTDREKWAHEIETFDVKWKMLSDLTGMKGDLAKGYNIHGIPMIFIVTPEGKIIGKGYRGDKMIEFIENLYK